MFCLSYLLFCIMTIHVRMCTSFNGIKLSNVETSESVSLQVANVKYPHTNSRSRALFPDTITLHIRRDGIVSTIPLLLERNTKLGVNAPVSIERNGRVVYQDVNHTKIVAFYQEKKSVASFRISTDTLSSSFRDFDFFGSFVLEGDSYIVQQSIADDGYTLSKLKNSSFVEKHVKGVLERAADEQVHGNKRQERSEKEQLEIEVLAVVDYSVYKFWLDQTKSASIVARDIEAKRNLQQYYAFVMNAVDVRYQTIDDQDYEIRVLLAGVHISDIASTSPWTEGIARKFTDPVQVDNVKALNTFTTWCRKMEGKITGHDHAMLFTKYDLTRTRDDGYIDTHVAGVANLGRLCYDDSQSVVEDTFDARVALAATHELGHSAGAEHDSYGNRCDGDGGYIMTSYMTDPTKSEYFVQRGWEFSACSKEYFRANINKLDSRSNCMLARSSVGDVIDLYKDNLPGQIYGPDIQCRNAYGTEAFVIKTMEAEESTVCTRMVCGLSPLNFETEVTYAWEGTKCDEGKLCRLGHCVEGNESFLPKPITTRIPTNTAGNCIASCQNMPAGNYQSCDGCHVYVTCIHGDMIDNRPCPGGLVWNDDVKTCDYTSPTC